MGARISKTNVSAVVSSFPECVCPRPSRGDLHKMEIFLFFLFFFWFVPILQHETGDQVSADSRSDSWLSSLIGR